MSKTYRMQPTAPAPAPAHLDGLNDQQRAVVTAPFQPALVIAGPGSGKTRTLTHRIAHLIQAGVRPERILSLTFTNKAAAEMSRRLADLLGRTGYAVASGTFHSIGRRLIQEHADRFGLPPNFATLDREDAEGLMKRCAADITKPPDTRFPKASTLRDLLSAAINTGRDLEPLILERASAFSALTTEIGDCIALYQSRKFEAGVTDFDDLLVLWRRLLREHDDVRETLQRRFDHLLVDEFQDTNPIQCEIVDLMAARHRSVMVVGDDCQAIYSFRGADISNILNFPTRYPEAVTYNLEQNYRSSPELLALANVSISHNPAQFPKQLFTSNPAGPIPANIIARDESEHAAFVAQRILELRDEGVELASIAVLYRAHWHSMELQIELGRRNIPFEIRSGLKFFEQRHIKDVLSLLKFVANPRDTIAFFRFATLVDGIGPAAAARIHDQLLSCGAIPETLTNPRLLSLPKRAAGAFEPIAKVLAELFSEELQQSPSRAIERLRAAFYDDLLARIDDNPANRLRDLDTLVAYAAGQPNIPAFLDSLALDPGTGSDFQADANPETERVILSSVHQAKGLEFQSVFLIWLAEDQFPSARSASGDDLEEERRLFYVAATRAKRDLYLLRPATYFSRTEGRVYARASLFLEELARSKPPTFESWRLE